MLVEFPFQVGDKIGLRGVTHAHPLQVATLMSEPCMRDTGARRMRFVRVEVDGREFEVAINRVIKETYILEKMGIHHENNS